MKLNQTWMKTALMGCGMMMMVGCVAQVDHPVEPVTPEEPEAPERVAQQNLVTPESQMEKLGRGVVALPQEKGIFISWRLLGTDDARTTFDVLRDGELIAEGLMASNYADESKKDLKMD